MRNHGVGGVAIIAMTIIMGGSPAEGVPAPRQSAGRVESLAWLQGCWQLTAPNRVTEEHWMRPAGGTMLGLSRTIRRIAQRDSTTEFEFLRLYSRDGRLVYAAQPSGQSPAEFTERESGEGSIVFENPQHDFPQRIIYRKRGADSLHARIEGTVNAQSRGIDYRYRRIACEGATSSS